VLITKRTAHRSLVDLPDGRQQLVGQWLQLVVDDENTIGACRYGDVSTLTLDHGDGVGQLRRHVLYRLVLGGQRLSEKQ